MPVSTRLRRGPALPPLCSEGRPAGLGSMYGAKGSTLTMSPCREVAYDSLHTGTTVVDVNVDEMAVPYQP